ncbi:hypothetical protein [Microbacterium sp.]|uniref:hypothetical protein n=1 Tax=Microbacterium sp. TaxID=51671 RepID=UPI003A917392
MNDNEFETQLDRVRRAAEVVNTLPKKLQATAFQILFSDVSVDRVEAASSTATPQETQAPAERATTNDDAKTNGAGATRKARRNGSKNPKAAPQDRELELFPEGKTSFTAFATEKAAKNHDEKYTVAVWWLLRVLEAPAATVPQVVSCYMAAGWALPSDVANAASQARKAGYLSSAKADDLKLGSLGINLVNNQLPRTK